MFVRMPTVLQHTGLSRTSLYRLMAEGKFPRAAKLTSRTVGWPLEAVETWMRNRINESAGGRQ